MRPQGAIQAKFSLPFTLEADRQRGSDGTTTLRLRDGREVNACGDPENPPTELQLVAKFKDCCEYSAATLSSARIDG
ncbi:MAG: hypothetical protein ABIT36_08595 [Steroidobacteraceae bacterium]